MSHYSSAFEDEPLSPDDEPVHESKKGRWAWQGHATKEELSTWGKLCAQAKKIKLAELRGLKAEKERDNLRDEVNIKYPATFLDKNGKTARRRRESVVKEVSDGYLSRALSIAYCRVTGVKNRMALYRCGSLVVHTGILGTAAVMLELNVSMLLWIVGLYGAATLWERVAVPRIIIDVWMSDETSHPVKVESSAPSFLSHMRARVYGTKPAIKDRPKETPAIADITLNEVASGDDANVVEESQPSGCCSTRKGKGKGKGRRKGKGRGKGSTKFNRFPVSQTWSVAVVKRLIFWSAPNGAIHEAAVLCPPIYLKKKSAEHLYAAFFLAGHYMRVAQTILLMCQRADFSMKVVADTSTSTATLAPTPAPTPAPTMPPRPNTLPVCKDPLTGKDDYEPVCPAGYFKCCATCKGAMCFSRKGLHMSWRGVPECIRCYPGDFCTGCDVYEKCSPSDVPGREGPKISAEGSTRGQDCEICPAGTEADLSRKRCVKLWTDVCNEKFVNRCVRNCYAEDPTRIKKLTFCESMKCQMFCAKRWSDECATAFGKECQFLKEGPSAYDQVSSPDEWLHLGCDVNCNGAIASSRLALTAYILLVFSMVMHSVA